MSFKPGMDFQKFTLGTKTLCNQYLLEERRMAGSGFYGSERVRGHTGALGQGRLGAALDGAQGHGRCREEWDQPQRVGVDVHDPGPSVLSGSPPPGACSCDSTPTTAPASPSCPCFPGPLGPLAGLLPGHSPVLHPPHSPGTQHLAHSLQRLPLHGADSSPCTPSA